VEEPRKRPPRPKRPREVVRASLEVAAVSVLVIVVLTLVGVVLYKGGKRTAPPGDALVVTQTQDFASLDPALAQTREAWELEYATCAKLLNYPAVRGYRGTRLVPEVAAALPSISRDRRTYTFRVRPGWRFSNGEPVTARSFTRAFERARSAELVSPADPYLREVSSWRVRGRTLTIQLRVPAPDFTQRLALPYFCAVPAWAPDHQIDTLPSAGPFAIERYRPGRSLVLRRNPYYHGPRRSTLQRIIYRFGAFSSQIRLQLEQGDADYGVVTPSAFAALAQRFKGDRRHLFVVQQPIVAYLALNTARPLFKDNPWLRRAVNYALDRPDLVRLFGPEGAVPNDEYLPPGFPGYQVQHVYPVGEPDVVKARALARGHLRGGHAVFLACGTEDCAERAIVVADALGKIGLHVRIDTSPGQFTLAGVRGTAFDIADVITRPDYGDPYGLVDKLLDGRVIRAVGNSNISYYASPAVNRSIDAAQRLRGIARDRAYGRLGIQVARTDAPLAAYAVLNARVFVSTRVRCITYQPVYGFDLAGACLGSGSPARAALSRR
jgi:peptide/nickel transport system substrate-binding protein